MFILYMFITYYLFVVVQTDGWGIIRELIWVIACHHKLDLLAYYYTTLSLNHLILAIKSIQGVYSNSLINQPLMAYDVLVATTIYVDDNPFLITGRHTLIYYVQLVG